MERDGSLCGRFPRSSIVSPAPVECAGAERAISAAEQCVAFSPITRPISSRRLAQYTPPVAKAETRKPAQLLGNPFIYMYRLFSCGDEYL